MGTGTTASTSTSLYQERLRHSTSQARTLQRLASSLPIHTVHHKPQQPKTDSTNQSPYPQGIVLFQIAMSTTTAISYAYRRGVGGRITTGCKHTYMYGVFKKKVRLSSETSVTRCQCMREPNDEYQQNKSKNPICREFL